MKDYTFNGLLKSEVAKAERVANKVTGFNDCKVTAYSSHEERSSYDPRFTWVEVDCEICRNYEDVVDGLKVHLSIPIFDRRRTKAIARMI
jgi:hypothetical protein